MRRFVGECDWQSTVAFCVLFNKSIDVDGNSTNELEELCTEVLTSEEEIAELCVDVISQTVTAVKDIESRQNVDASIWDGNLVGSAFVMETVQDAGELLQISEEQRSLTMTKLIVIFLFAYP